MIDDYEDEIMFIDEEPAPDAHAWWKQANKGKVCISREDAEWALSKACYDLTRFVHDGSETHQKHYDRKDRLKAALQEAE